MRDDLRNRLFQGITKVKQPVILQSIKHKNYLLNPNDQHGDAVKL